MDGTGYRIGRELPFLLFFVFCSLLEVVVGRGGGREGPDHMSRTNRLTTTRTDDDGPTGTPYLPLSLD